MAQTRIVEVKNSGWMSPLGNLHWGRFDVFFEGGDINNGKLLLVPLSEQPTTEELQQLRPKNQKRACEVHGSIEHMQSTTGECPGCGKS